MIRRYLNRNVWAISGSAFFADLGYQSVLAGFPLFLVFVLHAPVYEYGLASALSYGGGAIFSWLGGRLGDRLGHRKVAIVGNSLIPLLSLSALLANPIWAISLLTAGWWSRNSRSPSRRAMLVEAVPNAADRPAAFGFLHALDVGGGALAAVYLILALALHVSFRWVFLGTAVPLVVSTLCLLATDVGERRPVVDAPRSDEAAGPSPRPIRSLLLAAMLYGFTFYSVGFPVLTLAQDSHKLVVGVVTFLLLQVTSAATGYLLGPRFPTAAAGRLKQLGLLGYLGAGVGAAVVALGYQGHLPLAVPIAGVMVIGFSLGVVETLEPTAMSVLRSGSRAGAGFGALSAARSIGTFVANLAMGLLYGISASLAYGYAAILASMAGVVILTAVPAMRRAEQSRR